MVVISLTVSDTNLKITEGSSYFVNFENQYDREDFLDFKKDLSLILKHYIKEYDIC